MSSCRVVAQIVSQVWRLSSTKVLGTFPLEAFTHTQQYQSMVQRPLLQAK